MYCERASLLYEATTEEGKSIFVQDCSYAGILRRIEDVLYDGDFFDPAEKRERWAQYVGPIRSFA